MSNRLIAFEGIDGSGKSTQARRIETWLRDKGGNVKLLHEPGGTPVGEQIRKVLLSKTDLAGGLSPLAEFLLFSASRAELCSQIIRPLLDEGVTVLLDRFADSSVAYQAYGRGLDLAFVLRVNELSTGGLKPDLTLVFDLDPAIALSRITGGSDRIERSGLDFFNRVREGFLQIAHASTTHHVIDAAQDEDNVFTEVCCVIESHS